MLFVFVLAEMPRKPAPVIRARLKMNHVSAPYWCLNEFHLMHMVPSKKLLGDKFLPKRVAIDLKTTPLNDCDKSKLWGASPSPHRMGRGLG